VIQLDRAAVIKLVDLSELIVDLIELIELL
jgi:hypothetical protein